jgi:hypothetical protein
MGWVVNVTPRPLYPRERPGTLSIGGWVGLIPGLDGCGKSRPLPGFDLRTVQPITSRYTDCAIPVPIYIYIYTYIYTYIHTVCKKFTSFQNKNFDFPNKPPSHLFNITSHTKNLHIRMDWALIPLQYRSQKLVLKWQKLCGIAGWA